MGNLLTWEDAFIWPNLNIDRNRHISQLNDAVVQARTSNDKIFVTPNLFDFGCGSIFEILWSSTQSYEEFKAVYTWINPDEYITLSNLYGLLGNPTTEKATNWPTFNLEMRPGPNSMLGFECNCPDPFVFHLISWNKFHATHVANFTYDERCENYEYFKEYFVPSLKIGEQNIRNLIRENRVNPLIIRLDTPPLQNGIPLHGQQLHIHLGGTYPCALNIDGTWKHPNPKYLMPIEIRETLSKWGFQLPEEYYR